MPNCNQVDTEVSELEKADAYLESKDYQNAVDSYNKYQNATIWHNEISIDILQIKQTLLNLEIIFINDYTIFETLSVQKLFFLNSLLFRFVNQIIKSKISS